MGSFAARGCLCEGSDCLVAKDGGTIVRTRSHYAHTTESWYHAYILKSHPSKCSNVGSHILSFCLKSKVVEETRGLFGPRHVAIRVYVVRRVVS